jgi:uncharacterized LabA/DUF88 family protein
MASHPESLSMALFCDFENVALGVRDAQYEKFDIRPILERLLLKGSIVVKKAYCDWERYKGFKAAMHEANFELIEIPHVRQSGKNSADIRLVVDALDLCYTKSHVDTFVIISGDSDFSPLVSKLRENAKQVIGVGIKQSTSDLLIANCDEFIFYDDLVRESQRAITRREPRGGQPAARRTADEDRPRKDDLEARRAKAIELAVATFDALVSERGDSGKMWASVLKEAIKRRRPDFNESYFGFKAFGNLLEAAQQRGLIQVGRDEKSGTYVYRSLADDEGDASYSIPTSSPDVLEENAEDKGSHVDAGAAGAPAAEARRRGRGGRGSREHGRNEASAAAPVAGRPQPSSADDVMAAPEGQEAASLDAGPMGDESTASTVSQDMGTAMAEPMPASTEAIGPPAAMDAPSRDGAARKRPRRGRQDRTVREDAAQPAAEQAQSPAGQAAAMPSTPATQSTPAAQPTAPQENAGATPREARAPSTLAAEPSAQQRADARDDGQEAPAQPGGKARARKTRSGTGRAAKKAADAPVPVADPAASGEQASSDTTQTAEQPARKPARKRSSTRTAKKTGNAARAEPARDSGGE